MGRLSKDFLWIDGWLTLEPQDRLEVRFRLQGTEIQRQAHCLVRPAEADDPHAVARHWVLLVPVDRSLSTASRIADLTLVTETGSLLWHGAQDRFVFPEIGHRLGHPGFAAPLLADLDGFLDGVVGPACDELDDPVLRRNLESLYRAWGRGRRTTRATGTGGELADPAVETAAPPVVQPEVSIILTILEPPVLLNDQFLHLSRARPAAPFELIVVLGSTGSPAPRLPALESLADLYGLPMRSLRMDGGSWAAAARLGAEEARGELLVFVQGHTLTLDRTSLSAMLRPLSADSKVGVTAPRVLYFDDMTRSVGYEIREGGGTDGLVIRPIDPGTAGGPATESRIDACGADCFAVRRRLTAEADAFTGQFLLDDAEVMDLCLGAAGAGYEVVRVDASVTRVVERGVSSPDAWRSSGILYRHERCSLTRRRSVGREETPERNLPGLRRPSPVRKVTVVIPTYEPGKELAEVLDRIQQQESPVPVEVVVIDSGSRDGTRELLQNRGVRQISIDQKEFNHGLTRNLGIHHAEGEIVAFLSQDALPEPGWLAGLLAAFAEPMVAGAYSRQIPRSGASLWTREQLARWPATSETRRRQALPPQDVLATQTLGQRLTTVCFDNVSSAVRRSVALEIPFRQLSFGEDRDWAYRVMAAGYILEYCPVSTVIHSHDRSLWYELRRTFADHRSIHELLMPELAPASAPLWRAVGSELLRLVDVSARAPSARARLAARLAIPFRAFVGPAAGLLASRSVRLGSSGSRFWSWVDSSLTRGL